MGEPKLNQMNQILSECVFTSDQENTTSWKFDKSKNYFGKSFLMQVFGAFAPSTTTTSCFGGVWKGLALARVELLTWMTFLVDSIPRIVLEG